MILEKRKEEKLVVSWLKSHGYYKVIPQQNNHLVIEADGKIRKMIVAVSTTQHTIDYKEMNSIKELASNSNREAWLAVVEEEDEITWSLIK